MMRENVLRNAIIGEVLAKPELVGLLPSDVVESRAFEVLDNGDTIDVVFVDTDMKYYLICVDTSFSEKRAKQMEAKLYSNALLYFGENIDDVEFEMYGVFLDKKTKEYVVIRFE